MLSEGEGGKGRERGVRGRWVDRERKRESEGEREREQEGVGGGRRYIDREREREREKDAQGLRAAAWRRNVDVKKLHLSGMLAYRDFNAQGSELEGFVGASRGVVCTHG